MILFKKVIIFVRKERGFVNIFFGNVGSALLGALFWFLLASILKVGQYGEVNYYIALASIPATMSILGLDTTVTTYLAKGEKDIVYEANSIVLISSLFLSSIVALIRWESGLISISLAFYGMALSYVLGIKSYKEYGFMCIMNRSAQIAFSFVIYLRSGLTGILIGYFLGPILLSYRYLVSLKKFNSKIDHLKSRIIFTFHSYGFSLISCLTSFLDKIIIGAILGFHVLGLYQLNYQFLILMSTISRSFYMYLLPEESSGKNRREIEILRITISVIVVAVLFFISPLIVDKFFPNFSEVGQSIQVICLAVVPTIIVSISNAKLFAMEKGKLVLIGGIIYLIFLTCGFILLGKTYSLLGLVLSIVIAQTVSAIYLCFKTNLFIELKIHKNK